MDSLTPSWAYLPRPRPGHHRPCTLLRCHPRRSEDGTPILPSVLSNSLFSIDGGYQTPARRPEEFFGLCDRSKQWLGLKTSRAHRSEVPDRRMFRCPGSYTVKFSLPSIRAAWVRTCRGGREGQLGTRIAWRVKRGSLWCTDRRRRDYAAVENCGGWSALRCLMGNGRVRIGTSLQTSSSFSRF